LGRINITTIESDGELQDARELVKEVAIQQSDDELQTLDQDVIVERKDDENQQGNKKCYWWCKSEAQENA
jgi:hypothetical protein